MMLYDTFATETFNSFNILSDPCDRPVSSPIQNRNSSQKNDDRRLKPLRIILLNCQSIRNKKPRLEETIDDLRPDVIIGTESWLDPSIHTSEIFPSNFTVFRKDRASDNIFIAIDSSFITLHECELDTECEIIWAKLQMVGQKSLLIGALYRPPPPSSDKYYLEQLNVSLSRIGNTHHISLGGEFNTPDIFWENESLKDNARNKGICEQLIEISNDYG